MSLFTSIKVFNVSSVKYYYYVLLAKPCVLKILLSGSDELSKGMFSSSTVLKVRFSKSSVESVFN